MRILPHFIIALTASLAVFALATECLAIQPSPIPPPPMPMPMPMPMPKPDAMAPKPVMTEGKQSAYAGNPGNSMLTVLMEIKKNTEHYYTQAQKYEDALLIMRVVALICSVMAAAVLALSGAEWSRRSALLLSILSAAVPAADQIFQVSEVHRVSWRTAVDANRLFGSCKESWELKSQSLAQSERANAAQELLSQCRNKLAQLVDSEMDVSMKSLQLPARIEVK